MSDDTRAWADRSWIILAFEPISGGSVHGGEEIASPTATRLPVEGDKVLTHNGFMWVAEKPYWDLDRTRNAGRPVIVVPLVAQRRNI